MAENEAKKLKGQQEIAKEKSRSRIAERHQLLVGKS